METHTHQLEVGEDLHIPTITNSRYSNRLNKLLSPRPTLMKARGRVIYPGADSGPVLRGVPAWSQAGSYKRHFWIDGLEFPADLLGSCGALVC